MTGQDPWAPFEGKYKIHEESREFGRLLIASGFKSLSELGVEKAKQVVSTQFVALSGEVDFDGEEKEIIIPSPYTLEGIPVSVYKPTSAPEVPAIMVYFHGGGWVLGSRKTHEVTLKIIARDSGAIVVNVEYRLMPIPDEPYAPLDDAEVVTKWLMENKEAVGGKPNSKFGVGGDSSGGQLAIGTTNEVSGLDFQILVYPLADTSLSQDTVREFKQVPGLDENDIKFYLHHGYSQIPDLLTNPRVNGMARTNTATSPPALIILAELDLLRGGGIDYAEKLRAAGVKVQLEVIRGVPHAFFTLRKIFETTTAQAYDYIVKFLKQFQKCSSDGKPDHTVFCCCRFFLR
ncbi:unnamed protein product [Candidula unifasciata]|uniref:Alpha/beta hydrolase fold-3 domain-containing protein n=1 Tax=Candidula unifasciata TaxID=100452 RepID=A0A8S3YDQ7_9EUPU|nr:unnamed protein product [Candidula unifasciata]